MYLVPCRFASILQWALQASTETISETQRPAVFEHGLQNKPFVVKLQMFLELLFRRLAYDVTKDDSIYSKDAVLRILRKQDKDAGT